MGAAANVFLVTSNLLTTDAFPPGRAGLPLGIIGAAGALGALVFNTVSGPIIQTTGYLWVFTGAALLHPIALFLFWRGHPRDAR